MKKLKNKGAPRFDMAGVPDERTIALFDKHSLLYDDVTDAYILTKPAKKALDEPDFFGLAISFKEHGDNVTVCFEGEAVDDESGVEEHVVSPQLVFDKIQELLTRSPELT